MKLIQSDADGAHVARLNQSWTEFIVLWLQILFADISKDIKERGFLSLLFFL